MGQYKHRVFVCTSGNTCPAQGSVAVHAALEKGAAAAGLRGIARVNQAGCMNQCGSGPMMAVYPDDVWYAGVDVHGAERIVREHLVGGRVLSQYLYHAPPGDNQQVE